MRFCGGFRGIQNLASTENRSEADALAAERLRSALLAIDHTDRRADDQTGLSEGGDGLDESVETGPLINHSAREKVHRYVQIGKQEGARLLTGGEIYEAGKWIDGYFYRPTIFDQVTPSMRIAQEEIFGPVLSIIEVKSFEEAIEVLNGTAYGLSSSIYTNDVARAFRAMRDIEAGITYVNGPTIGAEVHLPFGGVKDTGNGHREAGVAGIDVFSEWKSIYVDYSGALQRAQIDTEEI